jgi:hypothetical protein
VANNCADLSWLEDGETVNEVLGCVLERRCKTCGGWECLASLWGIAEPSEDYRRVAEAELACEAMPEMKKRGVASA